MRLLSFILCLSFLAVLFPQQAEAQRARQTRDTPFVADVLTRPQVPVLPDMIEILNFPKMSFGESNKYFNDITTVQYQISLLNVLVERQKKNKEIQSAMNAIGIAYKEPPPAKSTCLELPRNMLCQKFYPELYSASVASSAVPSIDMGFQDFINRRTLPETSEPVVRRQQRTAPRSTSYLWADITCIFDSCRAVLIPEKGGSRFSVKVADEVGSKYVVGHISASKVELIEKESGKNIKLSPAPSSATGGTTSPFITISTTQKPVSSLVEESDVDNLIDTLKSNTEIEFIQ